MVFTASMLIFQAATILMWISVGLIKIGVTRKLDLSQHIHYAYGRQWVLGRYKIVFLLKVNTKSLRYPPFSEKMMIFLVDKMSGD